MLLSKNSKMKKSQSSEYSRIYNFTLPAFRSKSGLSTCPKAGVCAAGCYARMGTYLFSNVARKHEANLQTSLSKEFVSLMVAEIKKLKPHLVRIHDSGDFYNEEYFFKWIEVMRSHPQVMFYAYTKMVSMLKKHRNSLPTNFKFIFSFGGKEDRLINVDTDRHSKVFSSDAELQNKGYIDTSQDDTNALKINNKIGLVYHGNKKFENTMWNKSI